MPWQPDGELERTVQKILERARTQTALWSRQQIDQSRQEAAARGLNAFHAVHATKAAELTRFGATAINDVLSLFSRRRSA